MAITVFSKMHQLPNPHDLALKLCRTWGQCDVGWGEDQRDVKGTGFEVLQTGVRFQFSRNYGNNLALPDPAKPRCRSSRWGMTVCRARRFRTRQWNDVCSAGRRGYGVALLAVSLVLSPSFLDFVLWLSCSFLFFPYSLLGCDSTFLNSRLCIFFFRHSSLIQISYS